MKPKKDWIIVIGTITMAIMVFLMVFLISEGIEECTNEKEIGISVSKPEALYIEKTVEVPTKTAEVVYAEKTLNDNSVQSDEVSYEEYYRYYSQAWEILMTDGEFAWQNAREGVSEEVMGFAYDNAYSNYTQASNAAFEDGYNQGNSDGYGDGYRVGYLEAIEDMGA